VRVARNVQVGRNAIIVAQVGIAGSAAIGDDVELAGQAGIADHVRIESGVQVGAEAGVPGRTVLRGPGRVFWGTPARPIGTVLRELAVLARLAKR
jgi:UDP-3-O-[3-hydroxymyristoyl] glucosamine N-acyltransferase